MAIELKSRISQTAFALRGYNVTNLGRSHELLTHAAYGDIVRKYLQQASQICSDVTHRRVDLVSRVLHQRETSLKTYTDAICLIIAMELAQLDLLKEFFGVDYKQANLMYGYSLGEIGAVILAEPAVATTGKPVPPRRF